MNTFNWTTTDINALRSKAANISAPIHHWEAEDVKRLLFAY